MVVPQKSRELFVNLNDVNKIKEYLLDISLIQESTKCPNNACKRHMTTNSSSFIEANFITNEPGPAADVVLPRESSLD
jgi:hypothetical protein